MSELAGTAAEALLDAGSCVRVPQHIVYRKFPAETVMLNLTTGTYHGLNVTAGRMLEELERSETLGQAARKIATEFAQPADVVERDMCELCTALAARGLVNVSATAAR